MLEVNNIVTASWTYEAIHTESNWKDEKNAAALGGQWDNGMGVSEACLSGDGEMLVTNSLP